MSKTDIPSPPRVAAIDAYRGLVMFLMMAEVLRLSRVARAVPDSPVWQFLAHHQTHVEWRGCTLHDLIQPSFSFLVGVALPFSLAGRMARGQGVGLMTVHAAWRALLLVLLGVFLRSVGRPQTNFTFEDTLSQIGLGYVPLFLLGLCGQGGSGRPSSRSWSDTGRRSLPIRFPAPISTTRRWGCRPIGPIIFQAWRHIGTRTRTWPGPSINGS